MNAILRTWTSIFCTVFYVTLGVLFFTPSTALAVNILEYKDTLSDSGPLEQSNHTISFLLNTALSPGSIIEITPPAGFEVLATTTFAERNVELSVNTAVRTAAATAAPGIDKVEITTGTPGFFRYTLAPDFAISAGSRLEFKIGNHTSVAQDLFTYYSTSTGTTTSPADVEPIINATTLGRHDVQIEIYDGGLVAAAKPIVFIVDKVVMPNVDTTEVVPPYRFNPTPTSTVGGTTLSVEISLETDEFAVCKYSKIPDTAYGAMTNTFSNTGLLFHSTVVSVVPDSVQRFYVRCIDDEGNFNTDDFLIIFTVNDIPAGTSNTEGATSGDGTGTGDDGTGSGAGSGGTSGESDGIEPLEGGSTGAGGSGGGGGGGSGGSTGSTAGGGFEGADSPYQSGDGRVIINGYAYPNSTVSILVDGNFFDTTKANGSGSYSITLDEIARGVYTFGVYASGPDGTKSSTFSTSFTVTGARTSALSNVNVAPSILVEPDPADVGQVVTASGYALPNATVAIQNSKLRSSIVKDITVTSNASGFWTTEISTDSFSEGTYQIRAKSTQDGGAETNYSEYTYYGVGGEADAPINADLNRDGKVNLIDFSILLFWWNSNGGDSDPPADINRDGTVSLIDFSILLFNWTG